MQPDTIIPDLSNPQSWNRYSYVTNRPVNFNDPSGHRSECGEGEEAACKRLSPTDSLKVKIKSRYKWDVKGDWGLNDLQSIYETGQDIEKYVDGLTSGKGLAWMKKYMGDVSIARNLINDSMSIPGHIWLPSKLNMQSTYGKYYLTHELAHTWDITTGTLRPTTRRDSLGVPHMDAIGAVNGPADWLNTYMGGNVVSVNGCRNCDRSGTNYIPSAFQFSSGVMRDPKTFEPYGNNSTADYLSESFALNVYYSADAHVNPMVTLWVNSAIAFQASQLP